MTDKKEDSNNDLINIKGTKNPDEEVKIKLKGLPPNDSLTELKPVIKPKDGIKIKPKDGMSDTVIDSSVVNNWTDTNINTLRTWKGSLRQALYVYNSVLEGLKKKLNRYKIIILVFSTLLTLFSAISTYALANSSTETNIYIGLSISILNAVIGVIVTFLNGIIKIFNLDELVSSYTLYLERLDQLYSTIANQLTLPPKLRIDAFEFIKKENDNYLKLIKESPEMASSDYNLALEKFHKYLQDESANHKFASTYNNNDNIIEIV